MALERADDAGTAVPMAHLRWSRMTRGERLAVLLGTIVAIALVVVVLDGRAPAGVEVVLAVVAVVVFMYLRLRADLRGAAKRLRR